MAEGVAGTVGQVPRQPVVAAEQRGADLQDALGPLGRVPELLGSFDPIVELLDQRLDGRTGDG